MASGRFFSLGFIMLFVLCLLQHNCSARKVLLDDPKMKLDTKHQGEVMKSASSGTDQLDMNDVSTQGGIGGDCGFSGCECFEGNCHGGGSVVVPQPPHVVYPPPVVVYPPPEIVPTPPFIYPVPSTPCTPCEPWYGPGPCPCPCEEEGDHKEGVNSEGHKSSNKDSQEGGKLAQKESLYQSGTSATVASLLNSNNGKASEMPPGKVKQGGATTEAAEKMAMAESPKSGHVSEVDGVDLHV